MSKQSGLGDHLYISGFDASGDIGQVNKISGGPAALDVTAINKAAYERIGGLRDGGIDYTAFFNPGTDGVHAKLSALPYSNQIMTYVRGATLGGPVACCVAKQLNYDGTRADDGAFTFAGSTQGDGYGLEWGRGLTAGQRTDTTATDGDSVDFGVGSTDFGAQFYLHVFDVTGTSVTVTVEESDDDGATDAWAAVTTGAFTAATGVTSERLQTDRAQTVKQYLRAVTSGTFTNAVFAVTAVRNDVEVQF